MSIEVQIQLIIMSILFGFIFMIFYSFINEIFYKSKIRIFFELPLFLIGTITYYILIYKINGGFLNIYLILFLLIGILLYQSFYSKLFLYKYVNIHKKIIFFLKKHAIIKKKKERKKKNGKKRSTTNVRVEQKQSDNDVITWSINPSDSLRS